MPSPAPPVPLKDHCSVIYNHTLYTYSPDAFQSIPISEGGRWSQLPLAVSVHGGTCVKAIPAGDESKAALYVVGGSTNSSSVNYPGLQRYLFHEGVWEPVMPTDKVTQNRRNHAAVYLNSSASILIYAGSQDTADPELSSQTFLISTTPPYAVTSYSSTAPPSVRPLLLPWNESHAVMVGGSTSNRQTFTFSKQSGWTDLGVTLKEALPDQSKAQAALFEGDDGSKVLETFDLSTSPNTVNMVVLQNGRRHNGSSEATSVRTKPLLEGRWSRPPPAKRRKRDLTVANWPKYNASLAPNTTRSGFSLAQSSDDLVVMSGGGPPDDALSVFDVRANHWVDATDLWKAKATSSGPSGSASPSTTQTASSSSSSPTATGALAASGHSRSKALTILGATLGTICGVALLLVLALIWLRWRRRRRLYDEAGHQRRASGTTGDEKDRLSFADRGASFMSQAGGFLGHGQKASVNSSSSMAIMAGGSPTKRYQSGPYSKRRGSHGLLSRAKRKASSDMPQISRPKVEERQVSSDPIPARPEVAKDPAAIELGRQRSSGWSRYFAGNSATNLTLNNPSAARGPDPAAITSPFSDAYQISQSHPQVPEQVLQRPSLANPINFSRAPSVRVQTGESRDIPQVAPSTAVVETADSDLVADESPPFIQRHESSSTTSSPARNDAFLSGVSANAHEDTAWSPVGPDERSSGRATSSLYTDSAHGSMVPRNVSASAFPQVPRELQGTRASTGTMFTRGEAGAGTGAGSRLTNGEEHEDDLGRHNSDMSWLNLGSSRGEEAWTKPDGRN